MDAYMIQIRMHNTAQYYNTVLYTKNWSRENNSHCLILPRPKQKYSCFPTEIAHFLIKNTN